MDNNLLDPLEDGKSQVALLESMGGDLAIVNDAKVSYNRRATEMGEKEVKLLRFLLSANPPHLSPIRGTVFKFYVKAPLFVCRQWWKHHVASSCTEEQDQWNEQSLRYVEVKEDVDFYIPDLFLEQHSNNKQASGLPLEDTKQHDARFYYNTQCINSLSAYRTLLAIGVSREQARGVLVPAVYVTFHWTVSLQSVLNFIQLRKGAGAQSEIQKYAAVLEKLITPVVPHTMQILGDINGI